MSAVNIAIFFHKMVRFGTCGSGILTLHSEANCELLVGLGPVPPIEFLSDLECALSQLQLITPLFSCDDLPFFSIYNNYSYYFIDRSIVYNVCSACKSSRQESNKAKNKKKIY